MEGDLVTLRIPAGSTFTDLPTVGLAGLLRLHRIDPGGLTDLASSVQRTANEMLGGSEIEIDYQISDTEILIELRTGEKTVQINALRD